MKKLIFLFIVCCFAGCDFEKPTQFSELSLTEEFVSLDNKNVLIGDILESYKGKKVLINIWASWCKDCVDGLPNLRIFQEENPDVVYLFLSLDRSMASWKKGIQRFSLKGEHYFMKSGKKGPFGRFLKLWWVPRYAVLNEKGAISLYKATKITDRNIVQALKK